MSLKWELTRYPACISLNITGKCSTFEYFFIELFLIFYLWQSASVRISVRACPCLLDFLILSVLGNMIYLALSIYLILFLLGTVNFSSNSKCILGPASVLLSILSDCKFLFWLQEEAYKSGLDRKVCLYLYFVSFLM